MPQFKHNLAGVIARPISPDFKALFEALPRLYMVLDPQLRIVAFSDAYALATKIRREEAIGKGVFEVFPDNPDDPDASGVRNSTASFHRVIRDRVPDIMPVQRHDVRRPEKEGGGFEERYWSPRNSPVLAADDSVAWIIHTVEDVTELIKSRSAGLEQTLLNEVQHKTLKEITPLADIVRGMTEACCALDREWRFTFVNGTFETLARLSRRELLGRSVWDALPHLLESPAEANFRLAMENRVPVSFELLLPIAERWFEVRLFPTAAGISVFLSDIHARKLSEISLQDHDAQLQVFVKQAPVAIAMFDRNMTCIGASQRWTNDYGQGHADIVGMNHYDLYPELPVRWKEVHRKGMAGESLSNDEDLWLQADGSKHWLRWAVRPWLNSIGNVGGIVIYSEDITPSKQAEEALTISRQKFAGIVDSAMDGIISINADRQILLFNGAAEKMFRCSANQAIGSSLDQFIPKRFRAAHAGHVQQFGETGVSSRAMGHWIPISGLRADGEEFPIEASISQINVSGEKVLSVILRDCTERKQLERDVLEIGANEQRRIGQDLHDDVCQWIVGTQFLANALARDLAKRSPADAARVSKIADNLEVALIHTRNLSRELAPAMIQMEGLPGALHELAKHTEEMFSISCVADCADAVNIRDEIAALHLFRIAQEAVTNAVRHGAASEIRILLQPEGDYVTLRIRDNGKGIPQPPPPGSGMGLRIMDYRAGMVGARLQIRPGKDGGTEIVCSLPINL